MSRKPFADRGCHGESNGKSSDAEQDGFENQLPTQFPYRTSQNLSGVHCLDTHRRERREEGSVVDKAALLEKGLIKEIKNDAGLKVLGNGELTVKLTVKATKFSATAKEAIEKVGGTAEIE